MRGTVDVAIKGKDLPRTSAQEALLQLGGFRAAVRDLVRRVNELPWMEHAGEPAPWDGDVVRVRTLEDARRMEKDTFRPVVMAVWNALEEIGKASGRFDLMLAAEDYWIAAFDPRFDQEPSYPHDLLFPQIHSDIVGALREVILDDVASVRFFRSNIDWYERGHWRCAITHDGRPVVW